VTESSTHIRAKHRTASVLQASPNCDNCGRRVGKAKIEVTWKSGTKCLYHIGCYDDMAQEYALT
jgi:hypothetical protein